MIRICINSYFVSKNTFIYSCFGLTDSVINYNLDNEIIINMSQRIKVIIRPKPFYNSRQNEQLQHKPIINIDYANSIITINRTQPKIHNYINKDSSARAFAFSTIFEQNTSQQQVYEQSAFSLVESVLEGYNGTIFAYGQTGSGKTYTMMGGRQYLQRKIKKKNQTDLPLIQEKKQIEYSKHINGEKGIIPRSFSQIIAVTKSQQQKKHLITCSYLQIYNQNVHDLLGQDTKTKLSLKENSSKGLVIQGLLTPIVKSAEELQKYFKIGTKNRSIRQTNMNKESSRSHCIFTIKIQQQTTDQTGNTKFKVGKLNLVDLAGSERQNKSSPNELGIKEATKINLSLSALGKVINCLSNYRENQKQYIPYRDSKLTRILQDSLGGNTKTVMIATISAATQNYEQTLSTLIYASRAKFIQNNPIMNEDPKDVLLREYMQEIQKLKMLLMEKEMENEELKVVKVKPKVKLEVQINQQEKTQTLQNNHVEKVQQQEQQIKRKIEAIENLVKKDNIQNEERQELEKIEQLKKKIKIQQQRQAELERQKKLREEELLSIGKEYNTLNEEVDILRNKFKDLKSKYVIKCQELQDLRKQYNDDKVQFHDIIKQKDRQIKKMEKLLATLLQEQSQKQILDENQESFSQNESNYSTKKKFNTVNVENKSKIKVNSVNLYREGFSQKQFQKQSRRQSVSKIVIPQKQKFTRQPSLQSRNYQSQYQKKQRKIEERVSYTSLKTIDKQRLKREKIKKVDSLISLKPKNYAKLPFMTQIKKLNSSRNKQITPKNSQQYANKLGFDIARIKNEILNELKGSKIKNN